MSAAVGSLPFLAVVNPAAGGGRCQKLVGPALARLRAEGLTVEVVETRAPGEASDIAERAYRQGYRKFIAVGGDGTSYEIVNGIFRESAAPASPSPQPDAVGATVERARVAFLPLGTGNSFLRDFSDRGVDYAIESLIAGRMRPCDVMRLSYAGGMVYFLNLVSIGFTADVAALRARRFSGWGELGYQSSIFLCLARFRRRPFPLSVDGGEVDRRPCLFLTFNNSKYTGGTMMIAPQAEIDDGRIEFVRWGPIGRAGLIRNLPTLYDGTHVRHPLAERVSATRVDFFLEAPVDVMIDGEVLKLHCQAIDVLPAALDVMV